MREIKFRMWDEKNKQMIQLGEAEMLMNYAGLYFRVEESTIFPILVSKIMQYTGLKDRKRTDEYPEGQEIFEGDILHNSIEESIVSVRWDLSGARWSFDEHNNFDDGVGRGNWDLNLGYIKNCEVIGNIYENPNLIK